MNATDLRPPTKLTSGWGQRHRPTEPMEPGAICGMLTALRQLTPTSVYTVYRCACGAEVTRAHALVRKAMRNGREPKCKAGCKGAAK